MNSKGTSIVSHRNPRWHLKTGCPLCTVSSLVLVALPTQPPNGGKRHAMWNISLTSAPDWECWAFTQEQSRQWRFHIWHRGLGDMSPGAFSISTTTNTTIQGLLQAFLQSLANVQEFIIRILCLQFMSQLEMSATLTHTIGACIYILPTVLVNKIKISYNWDTVKKWKLQHGCLDWFIHAFTSASQQIFYGFPLCAKNYGGNASRNKT